MPYKKYYDKYKAAGICTNCGTRPARPHRITCQICSDKLAEVMSKKMKSLRACYINSGRCVCCSKELTEADINDKTGDYYTSCNSCRHKRGGYKY